MKKCLILAVMAILLISLSGQSITESKDVVVYWNIGPCWISLQAHPNLDLGDGTIQDFKPGDVIKDAKKNKVKVQTNCQGFTLQAEVDSTTTPSGFAGDIFEDFYWKVERWGTSQVIVPWQSITGMDTTAVTIETTTNPGTKLYNAGYKYFLDQQDIEGHYQVEFTYTVTS